MVEVGLFSKKLYEMDARAHGKILNETEIHMANIMDGREVVFMDSVVSEGYMILNDQFEVKIKREHCESFKPLTDM